jgi:hypothetical protein
MATGKRYIAMRDTLAKDLTNTDKIAMKMVNQALPDVYALNMNYGTYSIEKDSKINTSFTLYNHAAVERLIKDNPKLLPNPKVDIPKDLRWNQQHIQSAITQGILQGKSIPQIAKNLQSVTGMDERAAIRNARTAMTGAQNAGRLDSMKRAQARGIGVKKGWLATLDHVTRDSHVDLDGEVQELDRAFSNGLMFPGDASGPPAEVYNCFIPETKIGVDSKIIRSYKHRYEGEIISIKSALGVNFSCTPNHPILTDRGWVAAKFLNEGDNLIVTSCIDNEVSRRNPNINHAFPCIDTIHQLFDIFGGKRTSELRVNFHGDIPTSEVEIITQKGFLWSDRYASVRKCVNKFLLKYTNTPLMRKCSFVKHFGRIMRTTFCNISGVCKSFSFIRRCVCHSHIHGLRTIADSNIIFDKNTLDNLPTNVVLPSEIKHRLASKVFLDNVVSVERSNFSGHVYNLQTDDNYYFVNSSITNNGTHYNDIMAIAHNCRCRMVHVFPKYRTDWSNMENRNTDKLGDMSYEEWKNSRKQKVNAVKGASKTLKTNKEYQKDSVKTLRAIYENHRLQNNMISVPADELPDDFFEKVNYGNIDAESAKVFNDTIANLSQRYDTTLAEIRLMSKEEFLQRNGSFAFTYHSYETDVSTLVINPVKSGKYEKMVERITELVNNNYAVKIDEALVNQYVATHEFAHTLLDMQTPLDAKRNFVGADYAKIKEARKEVEKVYSDYLKSREAIEKEFKKYELDFLNTFSQESADKAREYKEKLDAMTISKYANVDSDEFMAECFTHKQLGGKENEYVDRIMEIIDKHFGR